MSGGRIMNKSPLFTVVLFAGLLPAVACNGPSSDQDAARSAAERSVATDPATPVGTSGPLPADVSAVPLDDASVTARIQAKYFLDQVIKKRRIDVDTRDGIVTLRGDVAGDEERGQALLLARTTPGVERVEDALTVNAAIDASSQVESAPDLPEPSKSDDEALTALVQSRFAGDPSLKTTSIEVTAKNGVLLVEGTAPTAALKQRALSTARATEGVLQVVDRIKVAGM
jgi:osmotically-inducible protein OsmY